MLKFEKEFMQVTKIKVVGIGGAGGNAVNMMLSKSFEGVEFAAINTDLQALECSTAQEKIQIGDSVTRGMGAGGEPETGRQAALDSSDVITECLEGVDILFLTAGFGGGTGTGATPVIAEIAKGQNALTVAVVTRPFAFEGKKRIQQAEEGIEALKEKVDTVICIPNDKLFEIVNQDTSIVEAFRVTDEILCEAVQSISRLITRPGLINLDFADIRTIIAEKGEAIFGFGVATGKDKVARATQAAITNPLLEKQGLDGARGILISIIGGNDMTLYEVNNAIRGVNDLTHPEANIIFGTIIDEELHDKALVTIIATGLDKNGMPRRREAAASFEEYEEKKPDTTGQTVIDFQRTAERQAELEEARSDLDVPTFIRKQRDQETRVTN